MRSILLAVLPLLLLPAMPRPADAQSDDYGELVAAFEALVEWRNRGETADLALRNLTRADGVGHGHPYRA